MKLVGLRIFVTSVVVVFFGDAINGDILLAQWSNALFHTSLNSISREVVAGKGSSGVQKNTRSMASVLNPAQDEDSPTVLDTAFPIPHNVLPVPESTPVPTLASHVQHTYLTLCTLLL